MNIQIARQMDAPLWLELRREHWPDFTADEHYVRINTILADSERAGFIAVDDDGEALGYLEAHIRFLAENCVIRGIGYVEDWYVKSSHQRHGIGSKLMAAAELWFQSRNCHEMAADVQTGDPATFQAHLALGFKEASHIVHLEKNLEMQGRDYAA